MAYTPKTWACDDTITADDLNHIEEGIAENSGGGIAPFLFFKTVSEEVTTEPCPNNPSTDIRITTTTYNYSWQEIYDALNADTPVFYVSDSGDSVWRLVSSAFFEDDVYEIVMDDGMLLHFESPSAKVTVLRNDSGCGGIS